jgi:protein-disulfide isomerase
MRISRILIGFAMSVSLSAFAGAAFAGQDDSTTVAEINGHKLTMAELEQKEAGQLLHARYQYYVAQRQALDQLIDERLLEMQAEKEHVTVEQLLQRHASNQAKDPTEDQLQIYYEGLETKDSFADVKASILDHIRQIRETKARAAYLETLRSQANILVALGPPSAEIALEGAPMLGSPKAPVQLVEFADYECPYCKKVHPELKKLHDEYGDKLAVAFKDFPLPMHAHSEKAAEAARCAGDQGKFWEFHDVLFSGGGLEVPQLKEYARNLKLDTGRFDKCLDSGEETAAVRKDFAQGTKLGLTGTPSFFINGHFLSGAVDYKTLRATVDQQLKLPAPTKESAEK